MTAATAAKLAELLDEDETFAWFADHYLDALDRDGGLQDVIADLRTVAGVS